MSGFVKGEYPFRYLRIPTSGRKLTSADCDVLVDNIVKKNCVGVQDICLMQQDMS